MSLSRRVCVASCRIEADDIRSYTLIPHDGGALAPFSAGAHIDVEIKPGVVRQYSLYNGPADLSAYKIAVLEERNGRGGSVAMHREVLLGTVLKISEPRNNFPLRSLSGCPLLIAGGIGVTPLFSMAQHLSHCGVEFEMHYCTRSRERTAFLNEIGNSPFARNVRFHFDNGTAEQRFDTAQLFSTTRPSEARDLYVCGPKPFIELVEQAAESAGWKRDRIHREFFAAAPSPGGDAGEFRIQLASSGRMLTVLPNKTVLDVLRENDVEIEVSCEQGVCGTCATRVLSGRPIHMDLYLSDEEKESGKIFMPCCSRGEGLLVLDL